MHVSGSAPTARVTAALRALSRIPDPVVVAVDGRFRGRPGTAGLREPGFRERGRRVRQGESPEGDHPPEHLLHENVRFIIDGRHAYPRVSLRFNDQSRPVSQHGDRRRRWLQRAGVAQAVALLIGLTTRRDDSSRPLPAPLPTVTVWLMLVYSVLVTSAAVCLGSAADRTRPHPADGP